MTDSASTLSSAITTHSLGRRFGGRVAVRDVSISLEAGDCLALFGPNGAGKTTLLRMLAGLLRPSEGTGSV
ncbi:MAG TPA: ATP-binding cassette domain-containing protein, partial [Gemmatimonadaceae bacterium]|nr:ATP-binding cassette domain-containing protein [Gemmatimonadaceae bacterium]